MSDQEDQPAKKRRCRNACRQCRQSKVKCGMEQTPCNRCQRLGYACEWDPMFRRTRNQDRFRELEERLRVLQQAGPANINAVPTPSSAGHSSASAPTGTSVPDAELNPQARSRIGHETLSSQLLPTDDTCFANGDIRLSHEDAAGLFAKFFEKYHVHVPFLDTTLGPNQCYRESEYLFWSIISVGAREQQPSKHFLSNLSPYFTESLGGVVLSGSLSLRNVQALLLQALWPPANVTFWHDRSMTVANLAVTGAMNIGLHYPYYEQEYHNKSIELSDLEREERTRTWVACMAVTQNLAMGFGLPLRLPFGNWKLQEVASLEASPGIPIDLRDYLIIHQHAHNIFMILPDKGNAASNALFDDALLAQLNKADIDMHNLIGFHTARMSLLNRLRYALVQLYLRSMHLQIRSSTLQRKQGVLKAYETATSIVSTMVSEDGASDILTYSPRTTLRILLMSACVIFKVLFSAYSADVDYNSGKVLFNAALLCLRQQAVQWKDRKDLPLRCVDFMKGLWHLGEISPTMASTPPEIEVQTRLGASVLYHCLAVFFDRLQFYYRQKEQRDAGNAEFQWSDSFDFSGMNDLDPQLAFGDFSVDFAWDPNLAQADLQGFL